MGKGNGVYVEGLTEVEVNDVEHVFALIAQVLISFHNSLMDQPLIREERTGAWDRIT